MRERIIHKAILRDSVTTIDLPIDAEILSVQYQRGERCVWYQFSPSAESAPAAFHVIPTDSKFAFQHEVEFCGTVQQDVYVWHIFLRRNVSRLEVRETVPTETVRYMAASIAAAQKRIKEIDQWFDAAIVWSSWMPGMGYERAQLVEKLRELGIKIEHKHTVSLVGGIAP